MHYGDVENYKPGLDVFPPTPADIGRKVKESLLLVC